MSMLSVPVESHARPVVRCLRLSGVNVAVVVLLMLVGETSECVERR